LVTNGPIFELKIIDIGYKLFKSQNSTKNNPQKLAPWCPKNLNISSALVPPARDQFSTNYLAFLDCAPDQFKTNYLATLGAK
jgi:hypothetical protein